MLPRPSSLPAQSPADLLADLLASLTVARILLAVLLIALAVRRGRGRGRAVQQAPPGPHPLDGFSALRLSVAMLRRRRRPPALDHSSPGGALADIDELDARDRAAAAAAPRTQPLELCFHDEFDPSPRRPVSVHFLRQGHVVVQRGAGRSPTSTDSVASSRRTSSGSDASVPSSAGGLPTPSAPNFIVEYNTPLEAFPDGWTQSPIVASEGPGRGDGTPGHGESGRQAAGPQPLAGLQPERTPRAVRSCPRAFQLAVAGAAAVYLVLALAIALVGGPGGRSPLGTALGGQPVEVRHVTRPIPVLDAARAMTESWMAMPEDLFRVQERDLLRVDELFLIEDVANVAVDLCHALRTAHRRRARQPQPQGAPPDHEAAAHLERVCGHLRAMAELASRWWRDAYIHYASEFPDDDGLAATLYTAAHNKAAAEASAELLNRSDVYEAFFSSPLEGPVADDNRVFTARADFARHLLASGTPPAAAGRLDLPAAVPVLLDSLYGLLVFPGLRPARGECEFLAGCSAGFTADSADPLTTTPGREGRQGLSVHPVCELLRKRPGPAVDDPAKGSSGAWCLGNATPTGPLAAWSSHALVKDLQQQTDAHSSDGARLDGETWLLALIRHTFSLTAAVDELVALGRQAMRAGKVPVLPSLSDLRDLWEQEREKHQWARADIQGLPVLDALVTLRPSLAAMEGSLAAAACRVTDVCAHADDLAAQLDELLVTDDAGPGTGWCEMVLSMRLRRPEVLEHDRAYWADEELSASAVLTLSHGRLPDPQYQRAALQNMSDEVEARRKSVAELLRSRPLPTRPPMPRRRQWPSWWYWLPGAKDPGPKPDYVFWWRLPPYGDDNRDNNADDIEGDPADDPDLDPEDVELLARIARAFHNDLADRLADILRQYASSTGEAAGDDDQPFKAVPRNKDYYSLLGVARDADARTVKRAYYGIMRRCHPDKTRPGQVQNSPQDGASGADDGGGPECSDDMADITEAYTVLSNPEMRAQYNAGGDALQTLLSNLAALRTAL